MPLQHAADGMLRRMRRGHGGARLRRVVERLRKGVPDLTFRTAFILGHPGETDQEFEELYEFVRWAEFDRVGFFRYSDEETSRSHTFGGKVPPRTAGARLKKLATLQRGISRKKTKALVGKELEVLVEGTSEEHELVMTARHAGQAPDIDGVVFLSDGEASPGEMRRVRITQSSDYDVVGELIDQPAALGEGGPPIARPKAPVRLRVLASDGRRPD
jgi:ribosomal protein S12 methylthiotransferase